MLQKLGESFKTTNCLDNLNSLVGSPNREVFRRYPPFVQNVIFALSTALSDGSKGSVRRAQNRRVSVRGALLLTNSHREKSVNPRECAHGSYGHYARRGENRTCARFPYETP